MNERQLGIFEVPRLMIYEDPDRVARILAELKFVPVRAELLYASDTIEYTGISDQFAEVDPSSIPPHYRIMNQIGKIEAVPDIGQERTPDDVLSYISHFSALRLVAVPK